MSAARFGRLAAVAAVAWASYAGLLGFVGGRTFEDEPWKAVVSGFVLAGALAVALEAGRRLWRRSRAGRSDAGHEGGPAEAVAVPGC